MNRGTTEHPERLVSFSDGKHFTDYVNNQAAIEEHVSRARKPSMTSNFSSLSYNIEKSERSNLRNKKVAFKNSNDVKISEQSKRQLNTSTNPDIKMALSGIISKITKRNDTN